MSPDPELVRSFGRCARGQSQVFKPQSVDDVNRVFALAKKAGQRIAIRGGGHSFGGQALHNADTLKQIVLSTDYFQPQRIDLAPDGSTVTLGAGVQWGCYVDREIARAIANNDSIRIPASMQTGRSSTAGGTLSGDCLSRFSGTAGRESRSIVSFRILTPGNPAPLDVNVNNNADLFNSVIGGHGYIGFVTDVTYKLIAIANTSLAHSTITTHTSFQDLIQKQNQLVQQFAAAPRAISSVWYTDPPSILASGIKGGVFNSSYANPSNPPLPGYPLYGDIHSDFRYHIELGARVPELNFAIHEFLYGIAKIGGEFENDLMDFIFFMDGNTIAKERFETANFPDQFPIVQQTFVIPTNNTEAFAENCQTKMDARGIRPTECDMLFVAQDNCFMSANYYLDGFAVTLAFEPIAPEGCPPANICDLLHELSVDCLNAGGRIHMPKNVNVDKLVFRNMFSPQIVTFENIKRQYDPDLLLGNPFSDNLFQF